MAAVAAAWLAASTVVAQERTIEQAGLTGTPVTAFQIGAPERTTFGPLQFVGGLALKADSIHMGAFPGLSVSDDGALLAVTDTGFWMTARIERNATGVPLGFSESRIGPLLDTRGVPFDHKWGADAEGLTIRNGRVFVSMEQKARILAYPRAANGDLSEAARIVEAVFPEPRLRNSFGLESIVALPDGRLLTIAEGAPNDSAPARAFLIAISGTTELAVARRNGFYITDATLLPDSGDILLLERNFTPSRGPEMQLRRIARDTIAADALLDGDVLLTVGRGYAIDNMEGVSAFQDSDGVTRIGLISDDNHWPLQRTLYLEFVLDDTD